MNFKSLLYVCTLALAAVSAEPDKWASRKTCYQQKGMWLDDSNQNPTDTRFGCLLPQKASDTNKYCGGFYGKNVCYAANLGNMNYCDKNSWEFNSGGCALSLSYLTSARYQEDQKHSESRTSCGWKRGLFLEFTNDPDTRFLCLLPRNASNTNNYCPTLGGKDYCIAPEYSNVAYCDVKDKNYNGKGCQLAVSYMWSNANHY